MKRFKYVTKKHNNVTKKHKVKLLYLHDYKWSKKEVYKYVRKI